jgi:hypothetical protein
MTDLAQAQLLRWRLLVCDPSHPRFWTQLVSEPSRECPGGSVVGDPVWQFPQEIAGNLMVGSRCINWCVPIGETHLTDPEFEPILTTCKTIAVNRLRSPGLRRRIVSTVKGEISLLIRLAVFLAEGSSIAGCRRIIDLDPDAARRFAQRTVAGCVIGGNGYAKFRNVMKAVQSFFREGKINDGFSDDAFAAMMNVLDDAKADPTVWPDNGSPPYSNEFCLGLINIADFCIEHLLDDVIVHMREMKELWADEDKLRREGRGPRPSESSSAPRLYAAFAANYRWKAKELNFPHQGYSFPPETTGDLAVLVETVQSVNLQIELLSTAGRESEVMSMDQNSHSRLVLDDYEVDLLSAKRFKTAPGLAGYKIGWPVSPRAVSSFKAQVKLAKAVGNEHLWIATGRGYKGRLLGHTSKRLQRFAARHRLDLGAEGRSYSKRFRPTVALLMTTGPEGHPHLAKRALGHKSLETTINYLRLNRHIQAELSYDLHRSGALAGDGLAVCRKMQVERVDVVQLASAIEQQEELELRARLVAPGIVAFYDPSDDAGRFHPQSEATSRSTLQYALGALSDRRARKHAGLFDWLAAETARIAHEFSEIADAVASDRRAKALLTMAASRSASI